MLLSQIFLLNFIIIVSSTQVTKVVNRNFFLNRKKRYLMFPEKSNMAITLALSKPLMQVQPRGFNLVFECDFPFALPSDTRLYKKFKRNHLIQKREILVGFEEIFRNFGESGTACVQRMICDAQNFINIESKSLIKDLTAAIFKGTRIESCHENNFSECSVSFFDYIIGSFDGELKE